MGMIYLSRKTKRPPIVGTRYWNDREMFDFMPRAAYDVPVEGTMPGANVLERLQEDIYDVETAADPLSTDMIGIHIERHPTYLTVTIGVFAT